MNQCSRFGRKGSALLQLSPLLADTTADRIPWKINPLWINYPKQGETRSRVHNRVQRLAKPRQEERLISLAVQ
jgi:hypothetical protein